jgi:hypothetical protein
MGELQVGSSSTLRAGAYRRTEGAGSGSICRLDCIWTKQKTTGCLEACDEGQAPGGRFFSQAPWLPQRDAKQGGRLALGRYLACGVLPAERICGALLYVHTYLGTQDCACSLPEKGREEGFHNALLMCRWEPPRWRRHIGWHDPVENERHSGRVLCRYLTSRRYRGSAAAAARIKGQRRWCRSWFVAALGRMR